MINFPAQKFYLTHQLIELAFPEKASIIEKTARIAASIFLAILAVPADLLIESARGISHLFTREKNDDSLTFSSLYPHLEPINDVDYLVEPSAPPLPEEMPKN